MNAPTDAQLEHARGYLDFVAASPSSYHAAHVMAERLTKAGFTRLEEKETWPREAGRYFIVRDGALAAWVVPDGEISGMRIAGSHTDSPGLKIKPSGSHYTADGWGQIDVETYGGLLLNSWLDRELGFAGRLVDIDGGQHLVATGPIARVPQLAVHLSREVNTKGLLLNPQTHLQPVWTTSEGECIFDHLASLAGLSSAEDIAGHDLISFTTEAPALFGAHQEFVACGRQDNLSSVYAELCALLDAEPAGGDVLIFIANDHEEIGSATRSGAAGPLLDTLLKRIGATISHTGEDYHRLLANTTCLSADAGHLVHPNYAELHDPQNHPVPGGGPVLKLNANQRYATDAVGSAVWERACRQAGVPHQAFVSNNAVACGSTIGPITATRLGITTVDVGLGLLSMHSAREMSHVADHTYLRDAVRAYYEGA